MSVLSVAPEVVSVAAGDLAGVGSAIGQANAVAAAPTLGVVAPAADSVSAELAALFGGHAEIYQAVGTQAQLFHQDFVNTLTASSATYARAEGESTSALGDQRKADGLRVLGSRQHQTAGVGGAASKLWQPSRPKLWRPGMSDPRLITPHHSLPAGSRLWHPGVPGFKTHTLAAPRLFTPHNELIGGVLNGSRGIVRNIGGLIEQIIQNQIGYLKLIGTSLVDFVKDELKAIIGLPAAFMQSVKDLLHGNISGAMNDVLKGFGRLFVDGMQLYSGSYYVYHWLGALPDLWRILQIPAQEMQNLADMLKPLGFGFAGKLVQDLLASPLNLLAHGWEIQLDPYGQWMKFNPLLQGVLDVLGAPIVSLLAFEDGLQSAFTTLVAGHPLRAAADILELPFNVSKAFLFGQDYIALPAQDTGKHQFYAHVGGLFAPGGYAMDYYQPSTGDPRWQYFDNPKSNQTGGIIPALVSTLPPKLQDTFHDLRRLLDGIAAKLMGVPALNY
ncbi:PE family protein [Mycobacterium simiae]|uniref:PE domain-containing protein n=1 Tax=Mycobacterium simiae TaxID=1784 RepID=A0A1X0XRU8_MYCSI|nr:PE family protein [Mycobacterium simiae]ORJ55568.1 hypothetical protein B5M45_24725 [Mycobacterium simiae]